MSDPKIGPAPAVARELSTLKKAVLAVEAINLGGEVALTPQQRADIESVTAIDVSQAKTLMASAYAGLVAPEALYVLHQKAKNAAIILAAKAQMIYAEALDNPEKYTQAQLRQCERLMDAAQLKWPEPPPVSDGERLEQMQQADVGAMTDGDLHQQLMDRLKRG